MGRTLLNKYKSYVGRVFFLRKCVIIPCYDTDRHIWRQNQEFLDRVSMLGDAVLIMDESNTRVLCTKINGGCTWIQKYYLKSEVPAPCLQEKDKQTENIVAVLEIAKKIKVGAEPLTFNDGQKLEEIAKAFRKIVDKL